MRQRRRIFVREWRKARGYTLVQLAERLHMTQPALSRIERGVRPYNQDFLEACAEVLQTDPASLLMRNPAEPDFMWSLWDRIPEARRDQASKVLETFADPAPPRAAPPQRRLKRKRA